MCFRHPTDDPVSDLQHLLPGVMQQSLNYSLCPHVILQNAIFWQRKLTMSLMHLKIFQNRWFSSPVELHLSSPFPQILVTWNDLLFLNRPSVSILQAFSHARNSQPHSHPCLENPSSSSHMRFRKYLLFLHLLLPTGQVILKHLALLSIILHWSPWIVTVFSFRL